MLGWSLEPALMVAVSGLLLCSLHLGRADEAAGCGGASRVVPTMLMVIQRVDGTATCCLKLPVWHCERSTCCWAIRRQHSASCIVFRVL